jgi:hypothetical protein
MGAEWRLPALDSSRLALRYDRRMDHDAPEMSVTPSTPDHETPTTPVADGARVAVLGLGTVGTAVASVLLDLDWAAALAERGQAVPRLVGVADIDLERERGLAVPDEVRQVGDYKELLDDDVDVVIELIGGSGVAGQAVLDAFAAGKSVVTANKDLLARRGAELEAAAREADVSLRFEAAVLAGVPVLGPLVGELGANRLRSVRGILNGTTNYILSTMAADAREYAEVLARRRRGGMPRLTRSTTWKASTPPTSWSCSRAWRGAAGSTWSSSGAAPPHLAARPLTASPASCAATWAWPRAWASCSSSWLAPSTPMPASAAGSRPWPSRLARGSAPPAT